MSPGEMIKLSIKGTGDNRDRDACTKRLASGIRLRFFEQVSGHHQ